MEKLLFNDYKAGQEGKFLKTEYICRVYPITENCVVAFDALGYENKEKFVSAYSYLPREKDNIQLILNQALENLFRNDKKVVWNNLELNGDYKLELVEIVNHEYDLGMTWEDIKIL